MTNKQIYVNMCINKRGTNTISYTSFRPIFLYHSFDKDYRVLKMMCEYWRVDLPTGFRMLANYIVTGDENKD